MSRGINKCIDAFDYFDKESFILSATSTGMYIFFVTVIGAAIGITRANFSFAFSITTEIVKRFLKTTRINKKKHNKIIILARSEFNSIKSLISKASTNSEII